MTDSSENRLADRGAMIVGYDELGGVIMPEPDEKPHDYHALVRDLEQAELDLSAGETMALIRDEIARHGGKAVADAIHDVLSERDRKDRERPRTMFPSVFGALEAMHKPKATHLDEHFGREMSQLATLCVEGLLEDQTLTHRKGHNAEAPEDGRPNHKAAWHRAVERATSRLQANMCDKDHLPAKGVVREEANAAIASMCSSPSWDTHGPAARELRDHLEPLDRAIGDQEIDYCRSDADWVYKRALCRELQGKFMGLSRFDNSDDHAVLRHV